jgi:hypothetical protein
VKNKRTFKDKCFKDKRGNVVIGQTPNLALTVAMISLLIGVFLDEGLVSEFIDVVTFGTFFTFAWLELFQGVNYFRRLYGFIVLAILLYVALS